MFIKKYCRVFQKIATLKLQLINFLILYGVKKPKYPYRIAIVFLILTVPTIGATQLGWYLYDQQTGFDYGMIVGTFSVIYAAWLMYEKNWREEEEDDDQIMEKLIFFGLVIPIFLFVLYLGGTAIMSGFSAKEANRKVKDDNEDNISYDQSSDEQSLSDELEKLNKLKDSGVLTEEEFEKAKNKLLNN